tara:strand:- start:192 stop:884 length:693 start_codon:yes stop_codon:yes gene_type:complete
MKNNWSDYSDLFQNKQINAVFSHSSTPIPKLSNTKNFAKVSGFNFDNLIIPSQIHSDNIEIINEPGLVQNCDGVFSCNIRLICSIKVADCMPIYFVHKSYPIFGLVHVGWKGLSKKILSAVGSKLLNNNWQLSEFEILIGPSIQQCCFEVDENIIDKFEVDFFIKNTNGKFSVSLQLSAKKELLQIGFNGKNIMIDNQCSCCNKQKFYSHRRDNKNTGRMIALLGARSKF